MPTHSPLRDTLRDLVAASSARTRELADRLAAVPETGFNEQAAAAILAAELTSLGLAPETGLALSGVRATAGPAGAPEIILLADMDALPTAGAPGGVMHSCGHHAQMAVMLAAFGALVRSGAPDREGFRLTFLTSPAEEYVELERRLELRASGRIRYLSGKQELIRLGAFSGAACVLKYHSAENAPDRRGNVNSAMNGFVAKKAVFTGKAAHAGAQPDRGVNALGAATLALQAIHAQRETFRDDDHVRVHPILREGGTIVNTVPDRAVIETYVRGANHQAIADASAKVDRAFAAGAIAMGASVRIIDTPGYQPFNPSPEVGDVLYRAACEIAPPDMIRFQGRGFASDDIGDVASLVPTAQLEWSGFSGTIHSSAFEACDPERAYGEPALILALAAFDLGADGGARARAARAAFTPAFAEADYFRALDTRFSERNIEWAPPAP